MNGNNTNVKKMQEKLRIAQAKREEKIAAGQKHVAPAQVMGLLSKDNLDKSDYEKQLDEYKKEAELLPTIAKKIEFWLKKASKYDEKIDRAPIGMTRNFFLIQRDYLRIAIALGSVQAALLQDKLIQKAVKKQEFHLMGDENNLKDPNIAASLRLAPLLNFYINLKNTITTEEKVSLHKAIVEALPLDTENRRTAIHFALRTEEDMELRDQITQFILALPSSANITSMSSATILPAMHNSSSSNTTVTTQSAQVTSETLKNK